MILNWALSLTSAVLLFLLFPRYNFVWLAPAALAPLLIACARENRWRWRAAYGYAAGFVYWFGLCNWIQWTLEQHAGVSGITAWLLFVLFCLAKAVQMAAFAGLAGPLLRRTLTMPAVPALWVALEWTHSYTAFEWLNLGNAASNLSLLLRLAPCTGVWGLSFLLALMSTSIAALILRRRGAGILLLPLLILFALPDIPPPTRGAATAVVVQPNIDDETLWSAELVAQTENRLRTLSLVTTVGHDRTDIVLWPEVPAPFYDYDPRFTGVLSSVAKSTGAGLLVGAVAHANQRPLNSALLIAPEGNRISRYDKVNLVPFGEFVPWPFAAITQKVSTETGDFAPGNQVVVSSLRGHGVGAFICYESVFPSYIRRFALSGAQVLFNLSNDSWFGKSQARYQHLQIVRMRAVENRRWIVRATNNGLSAAIDPAGRVLRTLPEYEEVAGRMNFDYRSDLTFYTQHGDWFVLFCAILAGATLAMAGRLTEEHPSKRGSAQ